MNKQSITIVGFGRFGRVLYRLLKDDFSVTVYSRHQIAEEKELRNDIKVIHSVREIYTNNVIFFAVPIDQFESVIVDHSRYFSDCHILIDVLSVKEHPERVLKKFLKKSKSQAILTHPMFGPDSSKNGFAGLPIVLNQFLSRPETYDFWKTFFEKKQLKVIELTPSEHDRLAAKSQGLTHFIGRLLATQKLHSSSIDTAGTKKLLEIIDQTCNDSWQLFTNLQQYNRYTKTMRLKLGIGYDHLFRQLLPEQRDSRFVTIGIQGGKGSFNEAAIRYYLEREKITSFKIKYLYTSERVLRALHAGEIDRGQFAIHNSVGGIVGESIKAMAKYKFEILDQYAIKISHALMIRKDAKLSEVTTIMTHPQVLAQCRKSLSEKYPHLAQTSGEGILVDHAKVAELLGKKKLGKSIATMGSSVLASLYDLTIIEDNLQDAKDNFTSFLFVSR